MLFCQRPECRAVVRQWGQRPVKRLVILAIVAIILVYLAVAGVAFPTAGTITVWGLALRVVINPVAGLGLGLLLGVVITPLLLLLPLGRPSAHALIGRSASENEVAPTREVPLEGPG